MSYKDWMGEVDGMCNDLLGVSLYDLPDMPTRDAYDNGTTPEKFFEEVQETVREELGLDPHEA